MGLEASGRLFLFGEELLQSTSTSIPAKKNKIRRGGGKGESTKTTGPLPEGRSADGAATHRLIDPSIDGVLQGRSH